MVLLVEDNEDIASLVHHLEASLLEYRALNGEEGSPSTVRKRFDPAGYLHPYHDGVRQQC